jgi:hypothetical protein
MARWSFFLAVLAIAMVSAPAHAWVEAHASSDDVRIKIDPDGVAHVEHSIGWRVIRGPLKGFELSPIEKKAVPEADVLVTTEDGRELAAQAQWSEDKKSLHVDTSEPKAFMRGKFLFRVRYTVDLVAAQELVRDGAMWRLAWTAPTASEGFDGSKLVLELPPAATEPRAVHPETGADDESVLGTLRRAPDRDELELVRPHVARGQAVLWSVRIDPRAFPQVQTPKMRPAFEPPPPPPDRIREIAVGAIVIAVALLFGTLVRHKERAFAALCDGAAPRGPVPLPPLWRAVLAATLLGAGVVLQILGHTTEGGALVALAMIGAALRPPLSRLPARGPGKWLALLPEDAFAKVRSPTRQSHWLDIGSRAGKVTFALLALVIGGLAAASRLVAAHGPALIALDALVLVPIFFTGRASQLTPDGARAPARWLKRLFVRLRARMKGSRVVPWARVPQGATAADELRILAVPRTAMPGLHGVEVGLSWVRTPTGFAPAPEVLVRAHEGSPAASRMAVIAPFARPVPGRREGERVYRLVPRIATKGGTSELVERLCKDLVDRRMRASAQAGPAYEGPERRTGLTRAAA